MKRFEHTREMRDAWGTIRRGLGTLGEDLDEARKWVGDREFLRLCQTFEPAHIIVACTIHRMADLVGLKPVMLTGSVDDDDNDAMLARAVVKAHKEVLAS